MTARRSDGGLWLVVAAALLAAPHLGPTKAPAAPTPHGKPATVSAAPAGRVLAADPRIRPASAAVRADLASGRIDPRVGAVLAAIARRHTRQTGLLAFGSQAPVAAVARRSPLGVEAVMSAFASDVREVLSVSAAQPGWRALFVEDSDKLVDFTMQLVGWAVVRITTRDDDTGDVLPRARTRIEGVVLQDPEVVSVFDYSATSATFGGYLSPDDPDPEPGTGPDGKGKVDKPDRVKGTRGRGRVKS